MAKSAKTKVKKKAGTHTKNKTKRQTRKQTQKRTQKRTQKQKRPAAKKKQKLVLPEEIKPMISETSAPEGYSEEEVKVPAQPQVGDPAPEFTLMNDQGENVSLSDFHGKKVVLYFYPKDDTPGCTKEACAFRDGISEIQARGAVVLGVSPDPLGSHQAFKQKYDLNFPLLSDVDKEVVNAYGVWKEKNMYGRTFMGVERTTFVIDEGGKTAKIFPKVDVERHYQEVLAAL